MVLNKDKIRTPMQPQFCTECLSWTSLGMLGIVAGHARDRSRFAFVAGLRIEIAHVEGLTTKVCLHGRAYNRVDPPA